MHDCVLVWTDPNDGSKELEIWLFSLGRGYVIRSGLQVHEAYERALTNTHSWTWTDPEEFAYMMPVVLLTNEE